MGYGNNEILIITEGRGAHTYDAMSDQYPRESCYTETLILALSYLNTKKLKENNAHMAVEIRGGIAEKHLVIP